MVEVLNDYGTIRYPHLILHYVMLIVHWIPTTHHHDKVI